MDSFTDWNIIAKELLKSELAKAGISLEEFQQKLAGIGVKESKAALSNKLSRGTFSARFLLQAMEALGVETVTLSKRKSYRQKTMIEAQAVREPSLYFEESAARWQQFGEFQYNSFEDEWYVDCSHTLRKTQAGGGKVISLFTGAGGLDIGLERAGFETAACVEIDADCKETLRRNRPQWTLVEGSQAGDIRHVSISEILEASNLRVGEAALVAGGAPCQPFSNIGKRQGVTDQKNGGDLFQQFVRVVGGVLPKAFIFENVVGITQQKHQDVLAYMQSCLSGLGYSLSYKVVNAADYGVPQKRNRFILIGLHHGPAPALPLPTHFKNADSYQEFCFQCALKPKKTFKAWTTVAEAFSQITEQDRGRSDNVVMNISDTVQDRMKLIGPGENFHALPMDMRPNCWKTGKHQGQDTFGRLKLDEPSVTIRTAAYNPAKGRYIHPTENRGLNAVELASLQGFPKCWKFYSERYDRVTLTSAGRQIGNAVPPLLAEALGRAISIQLARLSDDLLEKCI